MWIATRTFAKNLSAQGKPLHFTYFISGVYFLTPQNKNLYSPPHHQIGDSNIGFGVDDEDVSQRTKLISQAQADGHEIASHLVGHFDGTNWSVSDWQQEFNEFKKLVPFNNIVGIRTPLLSKNKNLYQVIKNNSYIYDASGVGKMGEWPIKDEFGTWGIPLVSITIPGINKNTLSMDYNEFVTQTGGRDILRQGTPAWNNAYQQIIGAYKNYFNNVYYSSRSPIVIANHFSLWNNSLYWEAMKTFASDVCGKPDVKCVTFKELVDYLDKKI